MYLQFKVLIMHFEVYIHVYTLNCIYSLKSTCIIYKLKNNKNLKCHTNKYVRFRTPARFRESGKFVRPSVRSFVATTLTWTVQSKILEVFKELIQDSFLVTRLLFQ